MYRVSFISFIWILTSCCQNKDVAEVRYQEVKDPLIEANRQSMRIEDDQIDGYVKRRKWPVTKTGTGLRYFIYEKNTTGKIAKAGQVALIDFEVTLLNGEFCYSTKESGPKKFLIEMDDVESGLHEGIQYLKSGEKAKFIIPSHLAHGLGGDFKKIPQKSSIVYDVHLISVENP